MRDYASELEGRIAFIKARLQEAHAKGIIYGNSGGKDSALVGILCKLACDDTKGVMMPCASKRNFESDMEDALKVTQQFGIESVTVDLTAARESLLGAFDGKFELTGGALANIAPRLRMITLYSIAASEGRIVAGTGNRSERYMGYFTKWGDGACDFNPISDLTVSEIYEFLRYLNAPESIITKAPSAGLFEGQTDEGEMGVTYAAIDRYLTTGEAAEADAAIIERCHKATLHKMTLPYTYKD